MKIIRKSPNGWFCAVYSPGDTVPKHSFTLSYPTHDLALRAAKAWAHDFGGLERSHKVSGLEFSEWAVEAGLSKQETEIKRTWVAVISYSKNESNELGEVAP